MNGIRVDLIIVLASYCVRRPIGRNRAGNCGCDRDDGVRVPVRTRPRRLSWRSPPYCVVCSDSGGRFAGSRRPGPDGLDGRESAAATPATDHRAGPVSDVSLYVRFRHRSRSVFAAADHCRSVEEGQRTSGAATVHFRDFVTGGGDGQPDVGRNCGNGGSAFEDGTLGLPDVLLICVPSTLLGVLAGALSVRKMGVELDDDPVYRERLARGEVPDDSRAGTTSAPPGAKWSVLVFLAAVVVITILGLAPQLRPDFVIDGRVEKLSMVASISVVTLSATALMLFLSKIKPDTVVAGSVMKAGIVAVISIPGIRMAGLYLL